MISSFCFWSYSSGPEVLFDNKEGAIQSEQNGNGDEKAKTKEQENNIDFVLNIVNSSGGVCGDISTCAIEFAKMDRKKKKPMAWKAGMCPSLICFIYQESLLSAGNAFETRQGMR